MSIWQKIVSVKPGNKAPVYVRPAGPGSANVGVAFDDPNGLSVGTDPRAVAIDAGGIAYTANYMSNSVSRIRPDGSVDVSWASVGTKPTAIVIDTNGNIYTANFGSANVSKIDPSGNVLQSWVTVGRQPIDMSIDSSGNIYVCHFGEEFVSKVSPSGTVTRAFATSPGSQSRCITVNLDDNIYFGDVNLNKAIEITPAGVVTDPWVGLPVSPRAFAFSDGFFYSIDGSASILKVEVSSKIITRDWVRLGGLPSASYLIADLSGVLFTSNEATKTISKVEASGSFNNAWRQTGGVPAGLAVDRANKILVCCDDNMVRSFAQ